VSSVFISDNLWKQITKVARRTRQRCAVAVAYFGAGASELLPLPAGSSLVVDASDRSVAAGQTCPSDLIRLMKRGVFIYTVANLHAKVFVLGRSAFIGSSNVSNRSASQLLEAAIRTNEPSAVAAAKDFVKGLCLTELTPTLLERLAKLYRPPSFPKDEKAKNAKPKAPVEPSMERVFLAQLELEEWSERDEATHKSGLVLAKKRRMHTRDFQLDSFRVSGKCVYQRRDVVVQVTEEGAKGAFVSPPGNVVHVLTRRDRDTSTSFVYLERPIRRRREVRAIGRELGYDRLNHFFRDGLIKDST
jgi:hypothetical protein